MRPCSNYKELYYLAMNKFLFISFMCLLYFSSVNAENVNQRLNDIEKRLEKIEQLLNPLISLSENNTSSVVTDENKTKLSECVKIDNIKTSIINDERYNEYFPYVEYSWMISYSNSCDDDISGIPTFSFLDKDGLILHDATIYRPILIPAKGSYNAKGTETLMSIEKIDRLYSSSAGLKNLRLR